MASGRVPMMQRILREGLFTGEPLDQAVAFLGAVGAFLTCARAPSGQL